MQPQRIHLIKGHGSENTFFIIDNMDNRFDDSTKAQYTKVLCNAKHIAGFENIDGVLFMERGKHNDSLMRIFNADGSEALMCGNGMRLAGRWSLDYFKESTGIVENVTHLPYTVSLQTNFAPQVYGIQITLPTATFDASFIHSQTDKIYLNQTIEGFDTLRSYSTVNMPNPHIIAFVKDIDDNELQRVGQAAQTDVLFPNSVNVSWVKVIDKKTIFVSTFERGVGLTNSCGTAMMASCITGVRLGLLSFEKTIKVKNKGGYILAEVLHDFSSKMTGNATYLAQYEVLIDHEIVAVLKQEELDEQKYYQALK